MCVCVCVCSYLLHSPLEKSSGTFYSRRGQCSDPRGEQRQCRVNRDVPPQLHNLTGLMKLFVMGFSPFSPGPVISGHASSPQRGWGQLISTLFSQCLLYAEQMITLGWVDGGCDIKTVCYNTRSIICKEHSQYYNQHIYCSEDAFVVLLHIKISPYIKPCKLDVF